MSNLEFIPLGLGNTPEKSADMIYEEFTSFVSQHPEVIYSDEFTFVTWLVCLRLSDLGRDDLAKLLVACHSCAS